MQADSIFTLFSRLASLNLARNNITAYNMIGDHDSIVNLYVECGIELWIAVIIDTMF